MFDEHHMVDENVTLSVIPWLVLYIVYIKCFFQLVAKCWVLFILEFLCICKSVSKYSLSSYIYIYKFDYVTKYVHIPVKLLTCCVFLNRKDPSRIYFIMGLHVKLDLKNVNTCTVARFCGGSIFLEFMGFSHSGI